jgi:DNA polymerase I-like protein with 3'-5' exonuclease and polymerase domains
MLKAALRMGADIHLLNTYGIDNVEPPPLEELVETHPKYPDHRGPRKHKREFAKVFCHATNYLGKAKTVAAHTGRTVQEIDSEQKRWFQAHPGILSWHQRVTEQVQKRRFVENRFGYRWYVFDRIDEQLLPAAVAWIPQSTVGIVINKCWVNFANKIPEVQVLLQVHDSLAGQFPTHRRDYIVPKMVEESRIVIPYDDPLIIPTGIKTSVESWGAVK